MSGIKLSNAVRKAICGFAYVVVIVGFAGLSEAQPCASEQHPIFRVSVNRELAGEPLSGRLVIMMSNQLGPKDELAPSFGPAARSVWLAAKEVYGLSADKPVDLDPDELAFPDPFCKAPAGNYKIRAVLNLKHNFAYHYGPAEGDLVSAITDQDFNPTATGTISLTLVDRKPEAPLQLPAHSQLLDFVSPSLSSFWGRPIHMRGVILLPPGYSAGKDHYPTVYMTHGYGGDMSYLALRSGKIDSLMQDKKIPEMIWVMLLEASPTGTHEFADSVNNGPWGTALTTELIPHLEKNYRMDAKASGRFLTGHSSGGWAAMWIQVSHPEFFGGTWPTAPDPVDFRSFTGVDLTKRPLANFYQHADGTPSMFIRMGDKDTESLQDLAQQERVMGEYSGQLASFEWVFSPRGKDGRPMPLFDRETGKIDADVAEYWEKHYDVATLVRENWPKIGPLLNGKIHLTVGTADTFHLDEPAHLLEQTIKDLGGKASFTYAPGHSHFDLYQAGLTEQIAKEMYAIARPQGGK